MSPFSGKFSEYAMRKEMWFFWLLLIPIIGVAVLSFQYVPNNWRYFSILILIGTIILIFRISARAARASYEVAREHALLAAVIGSLKDAVIAYDPAFHILVVNAAAEALFRVEAKELVGQTFGLEWAARDPKYKQLSQVLFPSTAPTIVKRSEPGQYPQLIEIMFEDPHVELRVLTVPMRGPRGEITGFIKVIHDSSRQAALLKSKSEFITVASHQLRTPLTAVNWAFQELLKADTLTVDEAKELIVTGNKAAQKMAKIVNDFLDVAKIEEGRFGYTYETQDIAAFIEKVVSEAALIAKQYKVEVYFKRPTEAILVPFDAQRMGIVLSNLIDNAIKYNVANGTVTVQVKHLNNEPFIEVSIEDTGIGVSKDDINKLFTKFFRTEEAMKMDQTGSGFGLYLVKNIIEQHGGKIWAESTIGRGTTFTFTLPTDKELIPNTEVGSGEEE